MKHWIFSSSLSNYKICLKYKVYGVDERYRITAQNHLSPGDLVFFYIKKTDQGKQVLKEPIFTGPWKIKSPATYNPNHPAVKEWNPPNTYLYIIPIEPLNEINVCELSKVFNKLLFITNRKKSSGGYSDHFQFSIISIREEDYNTILNCITKRTKLNNFIKGEIKQNYQYF